MLKPVEALKKFKFFEKKLQKFQVFAKKKQKFKVFGTNCKFLEKIAEIS